MPVPGTMVPLSPQFSPAYLKGIVIHPKDPLKFDFIIYKGDQFMRHPERSEGSLIEQQLKKNEYTKLVKYFLASLAIPDDDQWVNLSPYEKDRIIKDDFGKTEMGRDLLAQDYLLKQITASLIYPENNLGKVFWNKVYAQAQKQYGTTDIPVNTFNKVWILPDDALIYEKSNENKSGLKSQGTGNITAYVLKNHLRVMLEEDYLSLAKHEGQPGDMFRSEFQRTCPQAGCQPNQELNTKASQVNHITPNDNTHALASKIIKQILLPELQREVNEGANFAPLRQVYSGMLLATWFKRTLKQSLLGQIYANKGKVRGVDQDPKTNDEIYRRYLQAYKKGVFNFIKEDTDRLTNETVPRKYFSGGTAHIDWAMVHEEKVLTLTDAGQLAREISNEDLAQVGLGEYKTMRPALLKAKDAAVAGEVDGAMVSRRDLLVTAAVAVPVVTIASATWLWHSKGDPQIGYGFRIDASVPITFLMGKQDASAVLVYVNKNSGVTMHDIRALTNAPHMTIFHFTGNLSNVDLPYNLKELEESNDFYPLKDDETLPKGVNVLIPEPENFKSSLNDDNQQINLRKQRFIRIIKIIADAVKGLSSAAMISGTKVRFGHPAVTGVRGKPDGAMTKSDQFMRTGQLKYVEALIKRYGKESRYRIDVFTKNIDPQEVDPVTDLGRKVLPNDINPKSLSDVPLVTVILPPKPTFLKSLLRNSVSTQVRLGALEDGTPVALKKYKLNSKQKSDEMLLQDVIGGLIVQRSGRARIYGIFKDWQGDQNLVMAVAPGDFVNAAGEFITAETINEFQHVSADIEKFGGYMALDFQALIDKRGHIHCIDFLTFTNMRAGGGHVNYVLLLITNASKAVGLKVLKDIRQKSPRLFDALNKVMPNLEQILRSKSEAMVAPAHDAAMKGGIDLNPVNLAMTIKRDGNGIPIISQQDLAQLSSNLEGLDPVILSIKPASQTALFAELVGHP